MVKANAWKYDLIVVVFVAAGFEVIDHNIEQLTHVPFYYEFLKTAKWLLIGGFTLHGIISLIVSRTRK